MKTPEDLLSEISAILQGTGERISYLYGLPDLTEQEKVDLDAAQKSLASFTRLIQNQRTTILQQHSDLLRTNIDDLRAAKQRLDSAAKTINEINEIIHIATQVAAIAAGMMM